jgi:hypothetical protein
MGIFSHFDILDVLLVTYLILNVLMIPHTKIEEIFQVNNIYDHLYLGKDIPNYDFIIFDGVVYRTFLSSLMIAGLDLPLKYLADKAMLTPYVMLLASRVTLGILNIVALRKVRNALEGRFSGDKWMSRGFALVSLITSNLSL